MVLSSRYWFGVLHNAARKCLISNELGVSPGVADDALGTGGLRVEDVHRLCLIMTHVALSLTSTTAGQERIHIYSRTSK